ncbi:MAG TPA: DUF4160 domain-containing protein [Pyrinomonadaceae bacterium]|jgi:hypothetical protein
MPKVWEQNGFKFYVYFDDHTPSHVHVKKAGQEVVLYLGDENTKPSIRELRGMEDVEAVRALKIACKKRELLLREWSEVHD